MRSTRVRRRWQPRKGAEGALEAAGFVPVKLATSEATKGTVVIDGNATRAAKAADYAPRLRHP